MRLSALNEANIPTSNDGWQDEWPTEAPSLWWFYGRTSSKSNEPELILVEVNRTRTGPVFVARGFFLYKTKDVIGKWKKAEIAIPRNGGTNEDDAIRV